MRAATADTLIRASDAILGSPVDLAVAGDGRVWIADPQNHRIAVWNPADRSLTTVGREGDGPGELRDPEALVAAGGSILVLQPQAGRLSEFSESGEFMGSRNIGSGMILPLHISADSVAGGPSLGQDGTLVTVLDLQSGERTPIGRALADRPRVMSMRAIRDQALRGEFPVEFRNNVVAVAHRGAAWIISQYSGQIIHLTATDDTVWAATLPAAVIEDAHAEYFAAVETDPGRIRVPAIATDAQVLNNTLVFRSEHDPVPHCGATMQTRDASSVDSSFPDWPLAPSPWIWNGSARTLHCRTTRRSSRSTAFRRECGHGPDADSGRWTGMRIDRFAPIISLGVGLLMPVSLAAQSSPSIERFASANVRPLLPARTSGPLAAPQAASPGRIAGQVAGGYVAAAVSGFALWALVDDPEGSDRRVKGDAGYTPNANTAYAAASFVGATLAVYLIGRSDGSDGSLLATALGTGVATAVLLLGRHEPYLPPLGLMIGTPLQVIGGTFGYQRTRRGPGG